MSLRGRRPWQSPSIVNRKLVPAKAGIVNRQSQIVNRKSTYYPTPALIALVIVLTCRIMLPYRNIKGDSPLNKIEVRYGREAGSASARGWRMEKQQLPIPAHLGKLIVLLFWQ
jgi:hypothetical protein